MTLMLDDMRAEFARFLAEDPTGRWRMDKALAHVLTLAYQAGLSEGAQATVLARALLDPELFGHACTEEVRHAARRAIRIDGGGS